VVCVVVVVGWDVVGRLLLSPDELSNVNPPPPLFGLFVVVNVSDDRGTLMMKSCVLSIVEFCCM